MRKVVFTCIALIVLGASWLLFLEHHKRRFVDSLPKVPVSVTQPVETADSPLNTEKSVDIGAPVLEPSLIEDTPAARDSSLIENAAFQYADSLESSEEAEVSFEEPSAGHDSQVSSGERGEALAVPPTHKRSRAEEALKALKALRFEFEDLASLRFPTSGAAAEITKLRDGLISLPKPLREFREEQIRFWESMQQIEARYTERVGKFAEKIQGVHDKIDIHQFLFENQAYLREIASHAEFKDKPIAELFSYDLDSLPVENVPTLLLEDVTRLDTAFGGMHISIEQFWKKLKDGRVELLRWQEDLAALRRESESLVKEGTDAYRKQQTARLQALRFSVVGAVFGEAMSPLARINFKLRDIEMLERRAAAEKDIYKQRQVQEQLRQQYRQLEQLESEQLVLQKIVKAIENLRSRLGEKGQGLEHLLDIDEEALKKLKARSSEEILRRERFYDEVLAFQDLMLELGEIPQDLVR